MRALEPAQSLFDVHAWSGGSSDAERLELGHYRLGLLDAASDVEDVFRAAYGREPDLVESTDWRASF